MGETETEVGVGRDGVSRMGPSPEKPLRYNLCAPQLGIDPIMTNNPLKSALSSIADYWGFLLFYASAHPGPRE